MTVRYQPSLLDGVGVVVPPFHSDLRGGFTKVFSDAALDALGVAFTIREVYWSTSHTGVIRGLHFQTPPAAVAKLVFVTLGTIRDVVLDLRPSSSTYGRYAQFELTATSGAIHVPRGCAHGFEVLEGPATTCYLQDGPFVPDADAGVRWDSAGIDWLTADPIVSERDRALAAFDPTQTFVGSDV